MKCVFCDRDEKDVKYMLSTKKGIGICNSCVLQFAEKLNEFIKTEEKDLIKEIKSNNKKNRKEENNYENK